MGRRIKPLLMETITTGKPVRYERVVGIILNRDVVLQNKEKTRFFYVEPDGSGLVGKRFESHSLKTFTQQFLYDIDCEYARQAEARIIRLTKTLKDGEVVEGFIEWDEGNQRVVFATNRLGIQAHFDITDEQLAKLKTLLNLGKKS